MGKNPYQTPLYNFISSCPAFYTYNCNNNVSYNLGLALCGRELTASLHVPHSNWITFKKWAVEKFSKCFPFLFFR